PLKSSFISVMVRFNLDNIHLSTRETESTGIVGVYETPSSIFMVKNRKAFQILLEKFRPCSQSASSKRRSFPAGAEDNIPSRVPSAPNRAIRSKGSGELPKDLDVFLRCLSRTIP